MSFPCSFLVSSTCTRTVSSCTGRSHRVWFAKCPCEGHLHKFYVNKVWSKQMHIRMHPTRRDFVLNFFRQFSLEHKNWVVEIIRLSPLFFVLLGAFFHIFSYCSISPCFMSYVCLCFVRSSFTFRCEPSQKQGLEVWVTHASRKTHKTCDKQEYNRTLLLLLVILTI